METAPASTAELEALVAHADRTHPKLWENVADVLEGELEDHAVVAALTDIRATLSADMLRIAGEMGVEEAATADSDEGLLRTVTALAARRVLLENAALRANGHMEEQMGVIGASRLLDARLRALALDKADGPYKNALESKERILRLGDEAREALRKATMSPEVNDLVAALLKEEEAAPGQTAIEVPPAETGAAIPENAPSSKRVSRRRRSATADGLLYSGTKKEEDPEEKEEKKKKAAAEKLRLEKMTSRVIDAVQACEEMHALVENEEAVRNLLLTEIYIKEPDKGVIYANEEKRREAVLKQIKEALKDGQRLARPKPVDRKKAGEYAFELQATLQQTVRVLGYLTIDAKWLDRDPARYPRPLRVLLAAVPPEAVRKVRNYLKDIPVPAEELIEGEEDDGYVTIRAS